MKITIIPKTEKGKVAILESFLKYDTGKYKSAAHRGGLFYRLVNGSFVATTFGIQHALPNLVAKARPDFKPLLDNHRKKGFEDIKEDLKQQGCEDNVDYVIETE